MSTILVVEDTPDLRTLLVSLFTRLGYDARGADSASAGLAILLEGGVDVVISDWNLGDATGGSMLQRAATAGALEGIGVIIFSSSSDAARPATLPSAVLVPKSAGLEPVLRAVQRMLPGSLDDELFDRLRVPEEPAPRRVCSTTKPARDLRKRQTQENRPIVRTAGGRGHRIQTTK